MERTKGSCSCAAAYEVLLIASMILVLLYKFYAFDAAMLPRYSASASTLAGGLGVLLCVFSPLFLLPRRWRFALALAIDFALSFLLFADLLYMRYYADLPALRNAVFVAVAGEVAGSVVTLAEAGDARYFADIPLFALLMLLLPLTERLARASGEVLVYRRWGMAPAPPPRRHFLRTRALPALLCFALGLSLARFGLASYEVRVEGAMRAMWDRTAVATGVGSLLYHVADGSNLVRDAMSRRRYTAAELNDLKRWLDEREAARVRPPSFGAAEGCNLILIQVESLQSFAMGLAVGGVEVTPHLNALARQSLFFPAVYVQTASGNSSDAELLTNASLFPSSGGVAFARFANGRFETLVSRLKERGYRTAAYHGDRPGFWNRDRMYPALGFERYVSRGDYIFSEAIGLGLSDAAFFEQTLDFLAAEGAPFYAFLVTLSSHHPYGFDEIRAQVTDLPLGALEGTLLGDYLLATRYADRELGKFLAGLAEKGLLDRSVIAVYGDHAAIQKGESERLSELLNLDLSTDAAWRRVSSVPLLIRLPNAALRGEQRRTAGQIDVAPTLASLLGVGLRTAMGKDLTAERAKDTGDEIAIFRNGSFVTGDIYVLPTERRAFDLKTSIEFPYTEELEKKAMDARQRLMYSDMVLEM